MMAQFSVLGPRHVVDRESAFGELKQLALDNDAFFRNSSSTYGSRLAECCQEIALSSDLVQDLVKQMLVVSSKCDYDKHTPGNGYRSLISVCDMAVCQLISILRDCSQNRSNIMFRISHHCKEVEGFAAVLRFLILAYQQVIAGMEMFAENSLFPPLEGEYERYTSFLRGIESLDTSCFYARPLGFQFSPSVARIFRVIGFVLATYSLSWDKEEGPISSFLNSGKYLMSPEQRALRIVKVIRESDIEFCKGFWNLSELGMMSKWFCPVMAVCDMREITLHGPLPLRTKSGEIILVPEPSSHTGPRPIPYRMISVVAREGLTSSPAKHKPSPFLLIHCHGGGYVATSSQSHETYLREWACAINCPIVSIDYSLAPENPYPRATEEVLYTYTYILNNPKKFGWTGQKLVMVGDSAGGNLITSITLNLIQINAARLPDGIIPVYTPFLFQYLPSPSRVLSFMDPLLHMGVVIRCAAAYTGAKLDDELAAKGTLSSTNTTQVNGHKSLYQYVDEVQKAQHLDFDDSVFDEYKDEKESPVTENGKRKATDTNELTPTTNRIVAPKKRTLSQSLADTAAVAAGHAFDTVSDWFESPRTPIGINDKPKLNRAATLTPQMAAKVQQEEAREQETNFSSLLKLDLPRDPLISPMYASSELLRQLPPFYFVGCHLDPLLDDTIMFARKLRDSGGTVRRLDIFDFIPHGFLNFTLVSPDCREGSRLVIQRIKEAFFSETQL
uniref:Hormone-sensitive lipase n=1 Tax=Panagrolaimus davidi TaxID=227884 RepID=A0A914Q949_9BILA